MYDDLLGRASLARSGFENGNKSFETYSQEMNEMYNDAKAAGLEMQDLGDYLNEYNINEFIASLSRGSLGLDDDVRNANNELERAKNNISELDDAVEKSSDFLSQALASDIKAGDTYGANTDIELLQELGQAMVTAGKNTNEVAVSFAAAKAGYTEFAAAIADGKAAEMANSFIDYKLAIGETAENAVSGAALIQNGFESAAQAASAGGDAINGVISAMKSFGDAQGIFEDISTPDGVADKLSDMAHTMQLIPENKTITIDANGNLSVIEEAETQIASLKSQGNVDVSVNANGDFSVLNEVTGKMQTLQGIGAVSLQVNAQGNIDVLSKAGEIIATIDSKSAQINVNGQVSGMDTVSAAAETADNVNGKTSTIAITATDNASPILGNVQNAQTILNNTTANPTIFANDQASGVITGVSSKLDNLNGKTATTVVITKYETQGAPANNAAGTDYWRGGLTYVNDQNIADPCEIIEYNGSRWWYEGRDVLANIPKGARIYNASESRSLIDGSHRSGLDYVPYDGYIAELHRGERVLTSDEAANYSGISITDMMAWIQDIVDEMRCSGTQRTVSDSTNAASSIVFSPNITITGNADTDTMRQTMRLSFAEFKNYMREYERDKRRKEF